MIYQARNGISLGANESFLPQHQVSADTDLALGRLSTVLEWKSEEYRNYKKVRDYSLKWLVETQLKFNLLIFQHVFNSCKLEYEHRVLL